MQADDTTAEPTETEEPIRASLGQWAGYLLSRVAFALIARLPSAPTYAFAGWLGKTFVRLSKKRQKLALRVLHQAFPNESDDSLLLKYAEQGTGNLFKVSIDMILATRYIQKGTIGRYVDSSDLVNADLPKSWVGVTGHLGGWEAGSVAVSLAGYEGHATARGIRNPLLHNWLLKSRESVGLYIHDRRGGIRDVTAALKKGGVLLQVVDQHQRLRGVQATWFGKMASCERAAATLAVRGKHPVIIGAGIRIGNGFKFKWVLQEIVQPDSTGCRATDVQTTVEKVNRALEALILRFPEQYLWIHNRYRD